jgi:hypothetical protein
MNLKKTFRSTSLLLLMALFLSTGCSNSQQQAYGVYEPTGVLYNTDSLQNLVNWLDSQSLDTRGQLELLYTNHFTASPIDARYINKLDQEVDLGIGLMNARDMNFQILGDVLLQALSDSVQDGLDREYLDKDNAELLAVIDKLRVAQYGVSIPVSDADKFKDNLKKGNFGYVFTRFRTRCILDCSNGLCEPMCRWFWVIAFTGIVLLALLIIYRKKIRLRSRLMGLRRS